MRHKLQHYLFNIVYYTFGNQKCVTTTTHLQHCLFTIVYYIFGSEKCATTTTLLVIKNATQLQHIICLVHFGNEKCATTATHLQHCLFNIVYYTFDTQKCATTTLTLFATLLVIIICYTLVIKMRHNYTLFNIICYTMHYYTLVITTTLCLYTQKPQHLGFPCGPPPWY
jgi:ABC-type proline/glycine betaine transport system permease subunit